MSPLEIVGLVTIVYLLVGVIVAGLVNWCCGLEVYQFVEVVLCWPFWTYHALFGEDE